MLQIAKIFYKKESDYNNIAITIDIQQDDFTQILFNAARENPKRLNITNIEVIPETYLQMLGLQHREFDITLNGYLIPSANIPTAYYTFKDINYNAIPEKLSDMFVNGEQTCGEILKMYPAKGRKIPTELFPKVMDCFKAYTTMAAARVKELNQIKDWRKIEDFYVMATYAGHQVKPGFKVYSPSGKTYLEELFYSEYEEDIADLTQPLIAPLETIQMEMREYDLNVPDIRVIRDSKQAFKTTYTKQTYEDIAWVEPKFSPKLQRTAEQLDALPKDYTPFTVTLGMKASKPKFQGFTRPLEQVVYWPDQDVLLKKYANKNKERNIPNEIREELTPTVIQPNWWYNINHLYTQWLEGQSEEIREEFYPIDSEICPVCLCRYNVYNGCLDPETGEYHVQPQLELKDSITVATREYYDSFDNYSDSCFCQRVEAYLKKNNINL